MAQDWLGDDGEARASSQVVRSETALLAALRPTVNSEQSIILFIFENFSFTVIKVSIKLAVNVPYGKG